MTRAREHLWLGAVLAGVIGLGVFVTLIVRHATADAAGRETDTTERVVEAEVDEPAPPTDEIQHVSASPDEIAAAREQVSAALVDAKRKEREAGIKPGPNGILPASAGDNGTFDEPPKAGQGVRALTTAGASPERSAILIDRTAIAPANAPYEVEQAISAANAIVGTPYVWGGGHGSWNDTGYDCSGAVSYALGGAGLLGAPLDSTGLMSWGEPGPGKWITVYANAGHTYAVIAGLRWDTSGQQRRTGPKWYAEAAYPKGFTVRHPAGL